ncbi:MAG: hypothetical protein K9G59_11560 [Caulobacter sp.]|nr:hypothetical protein [Caulobacter sp.]
MRCSAPLAAALSLIAATGVQAQTTPAPSDTGPYLVLETSPDVLSILATGGRTRTGDEATLTWILLKNPPAADGAARTDIGVLVDCARKAMQQRAFAVRALDGKLMMTGVNPKPDWMPLRGGRTDATILALACEGTVTGQTEPDLAKVGADWRAARAAAPE